MSRRQAAVRRSTASRPDLADGGRWKVQLELAPAEIAFVYRRGLARGAEVCKRGTHEWRPLLTTPELREALKQRASLAEMIEVAQPAATGLTLSQTLAISDPSLAALLLARRSPQVSKSTPPPPPPAVARSAPPPPLPSTMVPPPLPAVSPSVPPPPLPSMEALPSIALRAPRVPSDSLPDWEDEPQPVRPYLAPLLPPPLFSLPPLRHLGIQRARAVVHARPFELSAVAALAVALTLGMTALIVRAEAPNLNALYSPNSGAASAGAPPAPQGESSLAPPAPLPSPGPAGAIPVVFWHDLPVEHGRSEAGMASVAQASSATLPLEVGKVASSAASMPQASSPARPSSTFAPAHAPPPLSSAPSRQSLARALGGAAAAARTCGEGPVEAQVVITFAPSGAARSVHFSAAPPLALRTCVLNAMSRAHVSPFQGEPVTVSKTLRW